MLGLAGHTDLPLCPSIRVFLNLFWNHHLQNSIRTPQVLSRSRFGSAAMFGPSQMHEEVLLRLQQGLQPGIV